MEIPKVVLTLLLSAVALFTIAKVMGHKQMAQLDFFDYIPPGSKIPGGFFCALRINS